MKARTPEKAHGKLQALDEARARWWRRLVRAVNAIDKIDGQRKRLLKPRPLDKLDPPVLALNDPLPKPPAPATLDIPTFLQRGLAAQNAADEAVKAELLAAEENKKKTHTRAVKEKRQARLKGELRKMPAQGKEALAIIRGES